MDFRIRQLESFLTLSSMLNFGRASEILFITQPALTLQIKGLEEAFATKLFDRTSQQVKLTKAGEALVGHARFIVRQVKEAHYDMHVSPQRLGLRVSCGEAGKTGIVPHIVRRLASTHPQFILEQYEYGPEEQAAALLDGRVDALLMQEDLEIEGTQFEALHEEAMLAGVSRSSPLAAKSAVCMEEIAGYPVIAMPCCTVRALNKFFHQACARGAAVPVLMEWPGSKELQFAAVEAGACIALSSVSERSMRPRGVKFVPIADPAPLLRLGLTTKGLRTRSIDIVRDAAISVSAELSRPGRPRKRPHSAHATSRRLARAV